MSKRDYTDRLAIQIKEAQDKSYSAALIAKDAALRWDAAIKTADELGMKGKSAELSKAALSVGVAAVSIASTAGNAKGFDVLVQMIADVLEQNE